MPPRAALGEPAVLAAMRAWRRGAGALAPWFRATPFASAHHYRDRLPPAELRTARRGAVPPAVARAVAAWPRPDPATLWILDLPAPVALWLVFALRRRWGLAAALCLNAWYDPRGVLDGRQEIALLLGLAPRLASVRPGAGVCLVFDADRNRALPADARARLDNRYALGEEDAPSAEQIRAAGWRRVLVTTWATPAGDLAPYLEYLSRELPVEVRTDLAGALGAGRAPAMTDG